MIGREADAAVVHFRSKLSAYDRESGEAVLAAQTLVNLFVRLDRLDEAIEVASQHLAGLPDAALICPGVAQLCQPPVPPNVWRPSHETRATS